MNRIAVTFALLCVLSSTLAFEFKNCGSEIGQHGDILLSNCNSSDEKCIFNRGEETRMSVKFTPAKDISKLEVRAFAVLFDVPVPFPLDNPDVCKDINSKIKCPLRKNQEVEYKNTLVLDKSIHPMNLELIWELVNEEDQKVICIRFPAMIK